MKIVIDISEAEYHLIQKLVASGMGNRQATLILGGTPLPKGHGRLIDVKDLDLTSLYMVEGKVCCTAPTVIEADKEKKNEQ